MKKHSQAQQPCHAIPAGASNKTGNRYAILRSYRPIDAINLGYSSTIDVTWFGC